MSTAPENSDLFAIDEARVRDERGSAGGKALAVSLAAAAAITLASNAFEIDVDANRKVQDNPGVVALKEVTVFEVPQICFGSFSAQVSRSVEASADPSADIKLGPLPKFSISTPDIVTPKFTASLVNADRQANPVCLDGAKLGVEVQTYAVKLTYPSDAEYTTTIARSDPGDSSEIIFDSNITVASANAIFEFQKGFSSGGNSGDEAKTVFNDYNIVRAADEMTDVCGPEVLAIAVPEAEAKLKELVVNIVAGAQDLSKDETDELFQSTTVSLPTDVPITHQIENNFEAYFDASGIEHVVTNAEPVKCETEDVVVTIESEDS